MKKKVYDYTMKQIKLMLGKTVCREFFVQSNISIKHWELPELYDVSLIFVACVGNQSYFSPVYFRGWGRESLLESDWLMSMGM